MGQTLTGTASPLPELRARDGIPDWDEIAALVKSWKAGAFVVGLPLNMDDTASELSQRAEKFARRLEGRFNLPCHLVDERLTSREARDISRTNAELGGRRHNSRAHVDSLSAVLILESWLADNG